MWADQAVPRLRAIGLGTEVAARTYRLTGIGESQVADLLGERLLRAANPIVATYARTEAVDVRVSAVAAPPRSAEELVDEAAATVLEQLGDLRLGHRRDDLERGHRRSGWPSSAGPLAAVEIGTGGSLSALFGDADWFRFDEIVGEDAPATWAHEPDGGLDGEPGAEPAPGSDLVRFARRARELGGAEVGVAVRTRFRSGDTAVSIALSTPAAERQVSRVVFLTGAARTLAGRPGGRGVRARGAARAGLAGVTDNGAVRTTLRIALVALALTLGACSSSTPTGGSASAGPTVSMAAPASQSPVLDESPTAGPSAPPSHRGIRSSEPDSVGGCDHEPRTLPPDQHRVQRRRRHPPPLHLRRRERVARPRLGGAPDGTQAMVLTVIDPDARDFVHWLVYDMTGTPSGGLPLGVSASPDAPPQGTNSFGKRGYGGPCPPSGTHHYRFTLSALDSVLELTGAPRIDALQAAMAGHVLAETTLTGTYRRS